jgi:hypothetical protein
MTEPMNMICPRWAKCSVPICPLDADVSDRRMLGRDPVCFYLSESVKRGAERRFEERGLRLLFQVMVHASGPLSARWSRIKRALSRATFSGSRWDALAKNRRGYE